MFNGTSTLNQLEKIIEKIGFPTDAEQAALETPYSKTMLENLRTGPESARKEWSALLPSADADAISFAGKLLTWTPEVRQHTHTHTQIHATGTARMLTPNACLRRRV